MHTTTLQNRTIVQLQQDYTHYENTRTKDEYKTWYILYTHVESIINNNVSIVSEHFVDGFKQLSLSAHVIPTMHDLNTQLQEIEWRIIYVHGFISTYQFAYLLTCKMYPININIRSNTHLLYSAEPDLIHDIIGHLPMLFSEEMRLLLCTWAHYTIQQKELKIDILLYELNVKIIRESLAQSPNEDKINSLRQQLAHLQQSLLSHPSPLWVLGNFFDWVFEFGLLKCNQYKVYGAAIITSMHEMQSVQNNMHRVRPLNTEIFYSGIGYAINQNDYYYVSNYTDYFSLLHSLIPLCNKTYVS